MIFWRNCLKSQSFICSVCLAIFLLTLALPAYADSGSLGQWNAGNSGTTDDLTGVAYGNGLFVATCYMNPQVGDDVVTSPDGVSWTSRFAATQCRLYDVAYGNGTFVAVGTGTKEVMETPFIDTGSPQSPYVVESGGAILTSPTGTGWSQVSGITSALLSVAYGNGTFVAVGYRTIMTSTDGKTWTSQTTDASVALQDVGYGNGLFVAVGSQELNDNSTQQTSSYILTSPDGKTWTSQKVGTAGELYGVTWGNGLFVAVGYSETTPGNYQGIVATSPDGSSWTTQPPAPDSLLNGVAYGDGLFMAVGVNFQNEAAESGIGDNYMNVARSDHSTKDWIWLTGEKYLGEVQTSPDGVNWTVQPSFILNSVNWAPHTSENQTISANLNGVAYGNGSFVVVGDGGVILQAGVTPATATTSAPSAAAPAPAPATPAPSSGGQQPIGFIVNQSSYTMGGQSFTMDGAPFVSNGRTLVPVRYLADALGAQTAWDAADQTITITRGGTALDLVIGSTAITTNGTVSQMDAAPVVENGRTYLPARYIAEAFGYTVSWDAAAQTINITD